MITKTNKTKRSFVKLNKIFLLGGLSVAILLKAYLILSDSVPFNSDEAIVALMARHILQGECPIFFYGQAYMGSLDAWLVAFGFRLFGEEVWVIRLVQGLLYLGTLLTTVRLSQLALGSRKAGLIAVWFLAVPTVTVSLYTTASLGGYGETLLLGNLILISSLSIVFGKRHRFANGLLLWLLWGFLVGFGVWVFGLTLIYSIPTAILLGCYLWQQNKSKTWQTPINEVLKRLGWVALGGILGASPLFVFIIRNGLDQLIAELSGSAIAGIENSDWLFRVGRHLISLLIFGGTAIFGMRPSWEVRWLATPLMPFVLAFWLGVLIFISRRLRSQRTNRIGIWVLVGVILSLTIGFVFTPFGADPSGRYFVPLAIPLALFASDMLVVLERRYGKMIWGLLVLVLTYNFWGTLQSVSRSPPGLTTQFDAITQVDHQYISYLIDFLQKNGEERGYTNYWVAYPLAYHSDEELIFTPRLPYHLDFRYTTRDNRYMLYEHKVLQSERVAYITTNHPPLDKYLRNAFNNLGVTWKEIGIGDYYVFYSLSRVVRPREIGLGIETNP